MKQSAAPTSTGNKQEDPIRWRMSEASGVSVVALVAMLSLLTPPAWGQDNATINGTVSRY